MTWKDASGKVEEYAGTTKDISSSGVCVMCSSLMQQGQEVDVRIDLPIVLEGMTGSRMSAQGTVVRNKTIDTPDESYELGIMFNRFYP